MSSDRWHLKESHTSKRLPNASGPRTRRRKSSVRLLSIHTLLAHNKTRRPGNFCTTAGTGRFLFSRTNGLHLVPFALAHSFTVMWTFSCPSVCTVTSRAPRRSMHRFPTGSSHTVVLSQADTLDALQLCS